LFNLQYILPLLLQSMAYANVIDNDKLFGRDVRMREILGLSMPYRPRTERMGTSPSLHKQFTLVKDKYSGALHCFNRFLGVY